MYKGRVAVLKRVKSDDPAVLGGFETQRFELEAGSFFGEAALMSGPKVGRRNASVQVGYKCPSVFRDC